MFCFVLCVPMDRQKELIDLGSHSQVVEYTSIVKSSLNLV